MQLDENLSTHVLREVRNMMRLAGHPVVVRFHEVRAVCAALHCVMGSLPPAAEGAQDRSRRRWCYS